MTDISSLCYFFVPLHRLTFSHELIEDGREKASYDIAAGVLTVQVPKLNEGKMFSPRSLNLLSKKIHPTCATDEHFENLDMLTTLLEKKKPKTPIIEVLQGLRLAHFLLALRAVEESFRNSVW